MTIIKTLIKIVCLLCHKSTIRLTKPIKTLNIPLLWLKRDKTVKYCCNTWEDIRYKVDNFDKCGSMSAVNIHMMREGIKNSRNCLNSMFVSSDDLSFTFTKWNRWGKEPQYDKGTQKNVWPIYSTKNYYITVSLFLLKFKVERKSYLSYVKFTVNREEFIYDKLIDPLHQFTIWLIEWLGLKDVISATDIEEMNATVEMTEELISEWADFLYIQGLGDDIAEVLDGLEDVIDHIVELDYNYTPVQLQCIELFVKNLSNTFSEMQNPFDGIE